ncbi:MAG: ATP-dependent carboxylate-amine ligase [Chloroflexi bacterium]|nr:ATP-dependent carboxylate-amine ligase [Chloroflexota bacterium]
MILILTEEFDQHADRVTAILHARGIDVVRFNPAAFPSRAILSVAYDEHGLAAATLDTDRATIDLTELTAIWYRRPQPPAPDADVPDPTTRGYLAEECRVVLNDIWHALACPVVPALPGVLHRAELRAAQLAGAARLGFELPPTLLTTSPRDFLVFYREHGGNVISKLPSNTLLRAYRSTFAGHTRRVSPREVVHAQALRRCPIILQARVPSGLEVRVTVVGTAVFPAEIQSQPLPRTSRHRPAYDHDDRAYRVHQLPEDVAERCRALVAELGLRFAAIELLLTSDGRYVLLEINPNGDFLSIEVATGLPISEAICDLLLRPVERRGHPLAPAVPA